MAASSRRPEGFEGRCGVPSPAVAEETSEPSQLEGTSYSVSLSPSLSFRCGGSDPPTRRDLVCAEKKKKKFWGGRGGGSLEIRLYCSTYSEMIASSVHVHVCDPMDMI